MAHTQKLLEVNYHIDSDTGINAIGEIDFGIVGTLDDYLKRYGRKGKDEIISTLSYLIYEVERRYRARVNANCQDSLKEASPGPGGGEGGA